MCVIVPCRTQFSAKLFVCVSYEEAPPRSAAGPSSKHVHRAQASPAAFVRTCQYKTFLSRKLFAEPPLVRIIAYSSPGAGEATLQGQGEDCCAVAEVVRCGGGLEPTVVFARAEVSFPSQSSRVPWVVEPAGRAPRSS